MDITLQYDIIKKLKPLYESYRYKVLYGGRAGMKSWSVAKALLDLGTREKLRILCTREFQNSIADSSKQLLQDQITILGLDEFYTVTNNKITGLNGTTFIFEGLRHNILSIKSMEGIDICWCEEAESISKTSWDILIPTVRKPYSEIWITFNPSLGTDYTYKHFVLDPPPNAVVIKTTWEDNPYMPQVLLNEKDALKKKDFDSYLNVWGGFCKSTVEGAVYKKEIRQATEENRFTKVPYDPSAGSVITVWDLGHADKTAIWFVQIIGYEYRLIDYYSNRQEKFAHYLKVLQDKEYIYGEMYLPHDAEHKTLQTGRSIKEIAEAAGHKVTVLPRISIVLGIEAARTIFPLCWFDSIRCEDGINDLNNYTYEVKDGQFSDKPKHNDASHGSDSFRYLAMAISMPRKKPKIKGTRSRRNAPRGQGWMS